MKGKMYMKVIKLMSLYFATLYLAIAYLTVTGCRGISQRSAPIPVEEIVPGVLTGYLETEDLPNSLALLPLPPEPGSAAFARDEEIAKASFSLHGTDRWDQAIKDAELEFPAAADAFSPSIGFQISEEETPFLYQVMRRTLADAMFSTDTAKKYYKRNRPYMLNGQPTGMPEAEAALRNNGSYPSGHTAIGWAWALILTEVVPEKTDTILQRGYEYGQSRMICNLHWQSDVDAGRIMGAAAVARLHADSEFMMDLERAKEEAEEMRTSPFPSRKETRPPLAP